MKKLLMLSFIAVLALTGCDASVMDTMSCSLENTNGNLTTRMKYDINYQNDEVKKVRITYDYSQDDMNNNGTNNGNADTNNAGNGTNNGTNAQNGTDGVGTGTDGTTNDTNNTGTRNATGNQNGTNGMNNNTGNAGTRNSSGNQNGTDGVGTGTDGTTSDTQFDNDGIIDGIVGSAIDGIVGGVTNTILDIAGLRNRHATVQNTYGNMAGFSVQNTTDTNNNYKVTYVIDYDTISDDDLRTLNLSRDLDTLRDSYVSQGFTCK